MSTDLDRTEFFGKTWIFVVQAVVFGMFGIFGIIFGPLFLFGIMKNAHGRPAPEGGIPMIVMSIPFLVLFALASFNIIARREPLLRLCREGLVINFIGGTRLDAVPAIPGLIRVAWAIVSLQGFKTQTAYVPWDIVAGAEVTGPPMAHTLTVFVEEHAEDVDEATTLDHVEFAEAALNQSLDDIAASINELCQVRSNRELLSSWAPEAPPGACGY